MLQDSDVAPSSVVPGVLPYWDPWMLLKLTRVRGCRGYVRTVKEGGASAKA